MVDVGAAAHRDAPSGVHRRVRLLGSSGRAPALVLAAVAAVQLAMLSTHPQLSNGDYYLRNAAALLDAELPHSRYSPGFAVLLVPMTAVGRHDLAAMYLLTSALTAALAVLGLWWTHRWAGTAVGPGGALGVLAVLGLGQASALCLGHGEVESLCLTLVAAVLLALHAGAHVRAAVLTTLLLLVRLPLGPFVVVLWLWHARAAPRAAALAAGGTVLAVLAQLATAPKVEQNYLQIGQASYDGSAGDPAWQRLLEGVLHRLEGYGTVGLPRLALPGRLVLSPARPVLAAVVLAVLAAGVAVVVRRRHTDRLTCAAVVAVLAELGVLMLWPVRPGESVRLVLPLAGVVLVAGAAALRELSARRPASGVWVVRGVALVVVLGLASSASVVRASRQVPADQRDFVRAHEMARDALPDGAVVSRKPGYSELATGAPGVEYPTGAKPEDLAAYAERTGACTFVVDALDSGLSSGLAQWVLAHSAGTLGSQGSTTLVRYDVPRCAA